MLAKKKKKALRFNRFLQQCATNSVYQEDTARKYNTLSWSHDYFLIVPCQTSMVESFTVSYRVVRAIH
jgi:hypothetical protein